MFQNNPLLAQLKQQLHTQTLRVEGTVKSTDKNFGFLETNNKSYFIPPHYMKKVIHGDLISAAIHKDKDREYAEPESLITPALTRFIGRIQINNQKLFVIADQPNFAIEIAGQLAFQPPKPLQQNDWVVANISSHPLTTKSAFKATITELITDANDNFAPWWVTLARNQLEKSAPTLQALSLSPEQALRTDLTHLPFFTIDGEKTEDMDDAIYIEAVGNDQLKLSVAIADPTAYIAQDDVLDQLAKQRAFSCYLPGLDIPMLPRELANDYFSLRPNEKRAALVCTVIVNSDGSLADAGDFTLAWVRSHAKLTYTQVSDWLEQPELGLPDNEKIAAQLALFHTFTQRRIAWRQQHALVFKDRPDYRFCLDEQGNVIDITIEQRRIANHLIEEAMIAVNLCAAETLANKVGVGVFNTHAGFDTSKLELVKHLLQEHHIELDSETLTTLDGFRQLRQQLSKETHPFLEMRIQRYQTYVNMELLPAPHFGLGVNAYATFTSPIRKYSDMVNHRLLKQIITGEHVNTPDEALLNHITYRRRMLRTAEREVNEWLYCRYLQPFIGNHHFNAVITDVTKGGLRAKLIENGANVFIPNKLLHPNRNELCCSPERGYVMINDIITYRQGDQLTVTLAEIKLANKNIIAKPYTNSLAAC